MLVQTLKGFRDFLPNESKKRQYVINTLKTVFRSFGFDPLETPALEYEDLLTGKYGDEGDKLMYRFEDNGGRRVALRYDQTVPLARVVAQYKQDLPMPFKRYQIQPVWRAENTQRGRFREFLQCDIDTAGTTSPVADAEILAIISASYQALGFKNFTILINDRSLFKDLPQKAITIIDKLKKIGDRAVKDELEEIGVDPLTLDRLLTSEIPSNLKEIRDLAVRFGVLEKQISFEPTLARGLDYYTGIIIEVEIDGYSVGSVGGGGRYDNLIGSFTNDTIPAVGFAFGFDRVIEALTEQQLFPKTILSSDVLVTVFSPELLMSSIEVTNLLRGKNIAAELYLDPTAKIDKQLKYADQKNIPYAIILGEEERLSGTVMVKNLQTRTQTRVSQKDLPDEIK